MRTRIYTDGACSGNPGPGGWAAILLFKDGKQAISGYEEDTTNNRMELLAVVNALKLSIKLECEEIEIYSDSAYVVNAINLGWVNKWLANKWTTSQGEPVKNKDLWKQLIQLLSYSGIGTITLIKVKGHAGNIYNEMADKLAREEVGRIKV